MVVILAILLIIVSLSLAATWYWLCLDLVLINSPIECVVLLQYRKPNVGEEYENVKVLFRWNKKQ